MLTDTGRYILHNETGLMFDKESPLMEIDLFTGETREYNNRGRKRKGLYKDEKHGIHKRKHTKLKEFQSSNKHGSISLKDSSKVLEGARHPALLRKQ